MIKKNLEKILLLFIILSIMIIYTNSIFMVYDIILFKTYSYILYIIGLLSLILLFFTKFIYKDKLKIIDCIVIIMSLFALISTLLSPDINISLFGFKGRYEGLFSILTYYSLFSISTYINNDRYKKSIIYVIFSTCILSIIYGFFQVTDILDSSIIYGKHFDAKGFLGNPNSFGAFCLVNFFLSLGLYLNDKKKTILIFSFIFLIGIFLSGTMSSVLTLILLFISLFIYYFIKNKTDRKKYIAKTLIILIATLLCFSIVQSLNKKLAKDVGEMFNQISDISKGKIDDSFGTNRIYIWKNTLAEYPKYIVHGIGIDRFLFLFGDDYLRLPGTNQIVDKAHNEYLQILVTEGIFALISYLIFLVVLIINTLKNNDSKISKVILLGIIAYLIQAFFNISITRLTPIIYILMGLMYNRNIKALD